VTETEQIDVDEKPVTVNTLSNGKIEVEVPEGLTPEAREKFISDVKEKSKTVGSYYRKLEELNVEKQDPAWIAFKEAYERGEDSTKAADPAVAQPTEKTLLEELGLTSKEQLTDYIVDNSFDYAEAIDRRAKEAAKRVTTETMEQDRVNGIRRAAELKLETEITTAGFDPKEVKAYARFLGSAEVTPAVFEAYRLKHAPKTDPVVQARLKAHEDQVQYIDIGSGRNNLRAGKLDQKAFEKLSDDDLAKTKTQLMDIARR
jgi:hypothetical protein